MDASTVRRPGAFSPLPISPTTPTGPVLAPALHARSASSDSNSSTSSQVVAMSSNKRVPFVPPRLTAMTNRDSANSSTTSLHNFSRPSIAQVVSDVPSRKNSPLNPGTDPRSHKRNNSQGFFEPSLPTATLADQSAMSGLSASQIAAQAAMQQQNSNQHSRKRSQTVPTPPAVEGSNGRSKPPPMPTMQHATQGRKVSGAAVIPPQYPQSSLQSPTSAAATAASAAYPRLGQLSPGLTTFSDPPVEKDVKAKSERSKMKLFSKPKHIGISSNRDTSAKDRPLIPSPGRISSPGPSMLYKNMNASTSSLVESSAYAPSIYSVANSSTSTLVPSDRQKESDKEKVHRHHFLSRQKNKFKDKMDDHPLTLSSASSNSKPIDPSAPQSIYSFAPSSPGLVQGGFAKSVSGFDLRHGGRALREKKREEKAAATALPDSRGTAGERAEWLAGTQFGPPSASNASIFGAALGPDLNLGHLQGFGVSNMTPEDAWDFLRAKILIIFEGERLRMPVEDLNRLVSIHVQRCIQKGTPTTITEDLSNLLQTGFLSLDQTLKGIPDEKLVPHLVEMWLSVFGTVLPYMQAVFLPLDLEFKGRGAIMSSREAADFWGIDPNGSEGFDSEMEVRRVVLLSYRDNVILPRHDILKAIFSRLSLESINVGLDNPLSPLPPPPPRPGTSASLDPKFSSFNSQGSTLLGDGTRSRATSNTSAPELPPFSPSVRRPQQPDSSRVTETVGRMLQCMSVLASLRSGDDAQEKMEDLTKTLKLNWLGRGRTGRNRKGFVGARVPKRANHI